MATKGARDGRCVHESQLECVNVQRVRQRLSASGRDMRAHAQMKAERPFLSSYVEAGVLWTWKRASAETRETPRPSMTNERGL